MFEIVFVDLKSVFNIQKIRLKKKNTRLLKKIQSDFEGKKKS
jgi:hypothetical protein